MAKVFMQLFNVTAKFSKSGNPLNGLTYPIMRFLVWLTLLSKNGKPQTDIEGLAKTWQNMFPGSNKHTPIIELTDDTAYAEIRTHCPLRGTGDIQACQRLMEYDRSMVKQLGGSFQVIESQSNSGNQYCKVMLKMNK